MKLSERLQLIADQIELGETMADIGTDHGFLPIYLKRSGICPKVILTDVSQGSLDKAREDCAKFAPGEEFDFRCGSGLSVLTPGEVDSVVIAGMGGILMSRILENAKDRLGGIREIIGEPQSDLDLYRKKLNELGFVIADEAFLKEDGKYYTVIRAVPGETGHIACTEAELLYGPLLLKKRDPLLMEYLSGQRGVCEEILRKMDEAGLAPDHPRRAEVLERMAVIDSALETKI